MVKIEVELDGRKLVISIPVDGNNEFGEVTVSGEQAQRDELMNLLEAGYGAFGHSISLQFSSPIDIHSRLISLGLTPVVVEGKIDSYDPEIPEDAVT